MLQKHMPFMGEKHNILLVQTGQLINQFWVLILSLKQINYTRPLKGRVLLSGLFVYLFVPIT